MLCKRSTVTQFKYWVLTLPCIALIALAANYATAKGQGPIGLWAATNRYVVVADKSLTGLVLVDLETGSAAERLIMNDAAPKGVASCLNCTYALISGSAGEFWRLHFQGTVSELLHKAGTLDFNNARLEPLELHHAGGKLTDGRMVLLGNDGESAFVASSNDHAVFRLDFSAKPNAKALIKTDKAKPFGLNWDESGNLLVSMHKREVWRITTKGIVLEVYNVKTAGCPGANELKPNLRAAIDDPVNDNSLLILASNPISYDAVVWRLESGKNKEHVCTIAAGKIGKNPGWTDAAGELIEFSRPHYFTLRPESQPFQLIISDIDNRALRLLDLTTDTSSTIMYDRDRREMALPATARRSETSCEQNNWLESTPTRTPAGAPSCARPHKEEVTELTYAEAAAHCKIEGARLCEPVELRRSRVASSAMAWTIAECASCWHRKASEQCAATIDTHKTPGLVHGDAQFSQSWNSGHALEIGASLGMGPATRCHATDSHIKAVAPCCADVF